MVCVCGIVVLEFGFELFVLMLPPIVLVREVSSWTLVSCDRTGGSVTGLYGWVEVCVRPSDVTVVVTAYDFSISRL